MRQKRYISAEYQDFKSVFDYEETVSNSLPDEEDINDKSFAQKILESEGKTRFQSESATPRTRQSINGKRRIQTSYDHQGNFDKTRKMSVVRYVGKSNARSKN